MGAMSFRQAMMQKINKRTTLCYRVQRSPKTKQWHAEIIGPFHHRLYGTCASASSENLAVERLKKTLLLDGWLGRITLSDIDEADTDKCTVRKSLSPTMRAAEVIRQSWE